VHQRDEWLWLDGLVEPDSGQTYWWILPRTDTQLFSRVLADFAQAMKVSKDKRVVLVLEQARWHISGKLEVPEGIHLMFLPPYSPELQPAERLWPLTNEPIANRYSETTVQELLGHKDVKTTRSIPMYSIGAVEECAVLSILDKLFED
jgi:integrase